MKKTKNKNKGSVVYEENLSLAVANWLMQKGFSLDTANEGYISIVTSDSDVTPKRCWDRILARDAWVYLGYINFATDSKGKPILYFTFYGRKYADMVRRLADEIASEFNAKIVVNLEREEPKLKTYAPPY